MKIQKLNSHINPIINRAGIVLLLMLGLAVFTLALWQKLSQRDAGSFLVTLGFLLVLATIAFNFVRDVIRQMFGLAYTPSEKQVAIGSIASNLLAGVLAMFIGIAMILNASS